MQACKCKVRLVFLNQCEFTTPPPLGGHLALSGDRFLLSRLVGMEGVLLT